MYVEKKNTATVPCIYTNIEEQPSISSSGGGFRSNQSMHDCEERAHENERRVAFFLSDKNTATRKSE